jgi:type IV secretion system protein VirD4
MTFKRFPCNEAASQGNETIQCQTLSRTLGAQETGITCVTHQAGRRLLTPDEVRNFSAETELPFRAVSWRIVELKLRYYADRAFAGLS